MLEDSPLALEGDVLVPAGALLDMAPEEDGVVVAHVPQEAHPTAHAD